MLDLATPYRGDEEGHFEPDKFEDQYEDALKELMKKKKSGEQIERRAAASPNVINLMDALRRSVEFEPNGRCSETERPTTRDAAARARKIRAAEAEKGAPRQLTRIFESPPSITRSRSIG